MKLNLLSFFLFLFSIFSYSQPLSGTYIIGDNPDDHFNSLELAVQALIDDGISESVVFKVRFGTYLVEKLEIPSINGVSANNIITIEPLENNSTVIFQSSNSYVMRLTKSDHFVFNNVTFELLDNLTRTALWLRASSNILISNCDFIGPDSLSNSSLVNAAEGHVFIDGGSSFYNEALQNSEYFPSNNIKVVNNNFFSGRNGVISFAREPYTVNDNIEISRNNFEGVVSRNIGIMSTSNIIISKNNFSGESNDHTIEFRKIKTGLVFDKNHFNCDSKYKIPIHIFDCQMDTDNPMIIKNNFFSLTEYMSITLSKNLKILNNNFLINRDNKALLLNEGSSNIEFYNNILKNSGIGALIQIRSNSFSVIETLNFDYNVYNPNNAIINYEKIYDSSTNYNLEDWKKLTGLEANSHLVTPNYSSIGDLHLNNDILIEGKGKVLPEVIEDIDGELRDSLKPDIGADEFVIDPNTFTDVEIEGLVYPNNDKCSKLNQIELSIKNNSTFPITSFDLEWWLSGSLIEKITIDLLINPLERKIINIGSFLFRDSTTYQLRFRVSNPNGVIDNNEVNSVYGLNYIYFNNDPKILIDKNPFCSGEYTLYVKNSSSSKISWSNGLSTKYIMVNTPGTYSVTITNENGCSVVDTVTID